MKTSWKIMKVGGRGVDKCGSQQQPCSVLVQKFSCLLDQTCAVRHVGPNAKLLGCLFRMADPLPHHLILTSLYHKKPLQNTTAEPEIPLQTYQSKNATIPYQYQFSRAKLQPLAAHLQIFATSWVLLNASPFVVDHLGASTRFHQGVRTQKEENQGKPLAATHGAPKDPPWNAIGTPWDPGMWAMGPLDQRQTPSVALRCVSFLWIFIHWKISSMWDIHGFSWIWPIGFDLSQTYMMDTGLEEYFCLW